MICQSSPAPIDANLYFFNILCPVTKRIQRRGAGGWRWRDLGSGSFCELNPKRFGAIVRIPRRGGWTGGVSGIADCESNPKRFGAIVRLGPDRAEMEAGARRSRRSCSGSAGFTGRGCSGVHYLICRASPAPNGASPCLVGMLYFVTKRAHRGLRRDANRLSVWGRSLAALETARYDPDRG